MYLTVCTRCRGRNFGKSLKIMLVLTNNAKDYASTTYGSLEATWVIAVN